ncbi:MAG TPA: DUF503 domain-containing protein [Dehalococcoidia bacterium]|nr:DUF503 domain-containing protein [Dehalococcoidia bacterium]
MTVGMCRVWLRLPENHSLKGKRQVLKSLVARIHQKFNVSVSEVDDHDSWQIASLGFSCVTNEEGHAHEIMDSVVKFIQRERPDMEFLDYRTEVLHALNSSQF